MVDLDRGPSSRGKGGVEENPRGRGEEIDPVPFLKLRVHAMDNAVDDVIARFVRGREVETLEPDRVQVVEVQRLMGEQKSDPTDRVGGPLEVGSEEPRPVDEELRTVHRRVIDPVRDNPLPAPESDCGLGPVGFEPAPSLPEMGRDI